MRACVAALCATSAARRSSVIGSTGFAVQRQSPFLPAVEVQNVVHQPDQPVAVPDRHLDHLPLLLRPLVQRARLNQPQRCAQRGQRRRNSWLTVEMNSSFIFSRRRRSLTSWNATTMPRTGPPQSADWRCTPPESPLPSLRQKTSSRMRIGSDRRSACRIGLVDRE